MCRWRGSGKSRTKKKRVKKEKVAVNILHDAQHTLRVFHVSLNAAVGVGEMKTMEIKCN